MADWTAAVAAITAEFANKSNAALSSSSSTAPKSISNNRLPQASTSQLNPDFQSNTPKQRKSKAAKRKNGNLTVSASASENEAGTSNGVSAHSARNSTPAMLNVPTPATQVKSSDHTASPSKSRYRSQLTTLEPAASPFFDPETTHRHHLSSSCSHQSRNVPSAADLEHLSYRDRLTAQLNSNSIDCPICINAISRRQPIASCQTCSAPYHLKCLRDWAERSILTIKEKAALLQQQPGVKIRAHWRCPSCQQQYPEGEIPRSYWCFCGRFKDPRPSGFENAHSCGSPCRRPRPEGCSHPCPLSCHPANCEPCPVMLNMQCHCGREHKRVACSALYIQTGTSNIADSEQLLSCQRNCDRILSCGLHRCDRKCHSGECGECTVVRQKTCYCAFDTREEVCGGAQQVQDRHDCYGDNDNQWKGEYSCGQPCDRKYDCGKHTEADVAIAVCHPHSTGEPLPCPRSPARIEFCPCGQTRLAHLSAQPRRDCSDPIATCGKTCGRQYPLCDHQCVQDCHEGDCGNCHEPVTVICRCGNDKRTLECWQQQQAPQEYLCDRTCRALRACGRHQCMRRCCPLAYQEAQQKIKRRVLPDDDEDPLGYHMCDRVCDKLLNCGNHRCEQPDHKGKCPPCLRSSFEEIACHCGSTVLIPPVPCSTKIICNQPCARPGLRCGHPKAPHTCHEDDQACPPCPFLTTKTCQCYRHSDVKNVRCSQATVSCGKSCGALLACGFHRCRKICHGEGEHEDCTQTCGKPRLYCGHACQQKCHAPSKCPVTEPCLESTDATCPCGHIKQRTRCGACTDKPSSNGGIKLACNATCAVAQRNANLAEALGITKDRAAASGEQDARWESEILEYYGDNLAWARHIEQILLDLIAAERSTHMFPAMKHPQRQFVHQLAERFHMRAESLDEEPFRSVLVTKRPDTATPKPTLSEAWTAQYKVTHSIHKRMTAVQPTSATIPPVKLKQELNALYLEQCFGYDEQGLKEAIGPHMQGMQFQLKWLTDEDVICLPRTSLTPSELTLKLRLVKTNLRNKIASCKGIDAAFYDDKLEAITHRDKSWSSVPTTANGTASASRWTHVTSQSSASNTFSGKRGKLVSRPASPASSTRSIGSAREVEVLTNGLHKAPTAVVIPAAANGDVADSWDDE